MKIGLMLAGGGAKGSYQIGVLKALKERKIYDQINVVSGTSIGSINALMMLADLTIEQMEKIWFDFVNYEYNELTKNWSLNENKGIIDLEKGFEFFKSKTSLTKIRNSKIKGYATLSKIKNPNLINQINIRNHELEVFCLNEAEDPFLVAMGSSSIPIVFGTTKIGENYYVDGGTLERNPMEPLLEESCNIIIAVPIGSNFNYKKYLDNNILLLDFENKDNFSHSMLTNQIDSLKIEMQFIIKNYQEGYKAGLKLLDKLELLGFLKDNTFVEPTGFTYIKY